MERGKRETLTTPIFEETAPATDANTLESSNRHNYFSLVSSSSGGKLSLPSFGPEVVNEPGRDMPFNVSGNEEKKADEF